MVDVMTIGIARATVECRALCPNDRIVPVLVEVSSVTVSLLEDNKKGGQSVLIPRLGVTPELDLEAFGIGVP